jgi:hypothetical protein
MSRSRYFAAALEGIAATVTAGGDYTRQDLNAAAFKVGGLLHLDGADESQAVARLTDAALSANPKLDRDKLAREITKNLNAGRSKPYTPPDKSRAAYAAPMPPRPRPTPPAAPPAAPTAAKVSPAELAAFWSSLAYVTDPAAAPVAAWLRRRFPSWPLTAWLVGDLVRALPERGLTAPLPSWATVGPRAWNRTAERHLAIFETFGPSGETVGLRARAVTEEPTPRPERWSKSAAGKGQATGLLADAEAVAMLRDRTSAPALLVLEGEPDFLAVAGAKVAEAVTVSEALLAAHETGAQRPTLPPLFGAVVGLVGSVSALHLATFDRLLEALPDGARVYLGPHADARGDDYRDKLRARLAVARRTFEVRDLPPTALTLTGDPT